MLIDIQKAKEQFKKYVSNYNSKDEKIRIKIEHIERVAEISKQLAQNLKLSEEDVQLAELIGLLHDIGRFEQIRLYNTFLDKDSINHGEFGAKILIEDGLIRKFIETDKYDRIIKLAVLNHNKTIVQEGMTERELLHTKIVRDADKIDIFSILITDSKKNLFGKEDLSNERITDEMYREFIEDKKINYKEIKTTADNIVCYFNYVFDLNFEQTKQIIKEKQYLDKLYQRFTFRDEETMKRYNNMYRLAKEYIEQ